MIALPMGRNPQEMMLELVQNILFDVQPVIHVVYI